MRTASFGVLSWIVVVACIGAQPPEQGPPAEFTPLFNGKDLSGWVLHNCTDKDWDVKDGVLATIPGKGARVTAWMLSEEYYDDFELRLEYQLVTKKADSGVALRAGGDNPSVNGLEIQLLDDESYPKQKEQEKTGALWGLVAPVKGAAKPLGEWNRLYITFIERKLKVVLNDVTVQDIDLNDLINTHSGHAGLRRESGHVGLQTRIGVVNFRNVQIKPLAKSPDEPAGPAVTLDPGMHTGKIQGVFFRDKGKQLVTVGDDHTIRLWDAEDKELRQIDVIHPPGFGELLNAELSPDGNLLAFSTQYAEKGRSQSVIYVLNLPDRGIARIIRSDARNPRQLRDARLAFSGDGKRFAAITWNQPIFVWDLATDAPPTKIWPGKPYCYGRLAFSPDGKRIAWASGASNENDGALLDVETGKKLADVPGIRVAWSPDSKTIVTNQMKAIRLHDTDGKLVHTFELERAIGWEGWKSFVVSPDSNYLLVNGGMLLFDLLNKQPKAPLKSPHDAYAGPYGHFSPDSKLVVTAGTSRQGDNWIVVRDLKTGGIRGQRLGRGMFSGGWLASESRWSTDGKSVSWRNEKVTELPAKNPQRKDPYLQQATFHLGTLELLSTLKAGESHSYRVLNRDNLALELTDPMKGEWSLLRDGKPIASLNKAANRTIGSPTFLGKDRIAALAGYYGEGIVLFDLSGNLIRQLAPGYRESYSPVVLSPSPDGRLMMTYRYDRSLYLWNQEQKHPLLTLYRIGQDWIFWTQEGYYAATPGGERLISWKVNNGIDKMPSVYPADRFRKQLHRPDIIKLVVEKGSVAEALKTANADAKIETRSVTVENLLPPRVVLTVDPSMKPTYKLKVQAEASTKDQPITSLRLKINNKIVLGNKAYTEFPGGKLKAEAEWTIELPEGEHQLNVMARSADAVGYSASKQVKFRPLAKMPTLHLLSVGINDYDDGSLNLKYAVPDAQALPKAFVKACKGVNFLDVVPYVLLNKDASQENVLTKLGEIRKEAKPQDLVVVFFACHGVKDKNGYYLLTHETNVKDLAGTTLKGSDLRKELAQFKSQVLLMMDACYSNAIGLKSATDDATRDLTDDDVGVAVMCAAMSHEKAEGIDGHGRFTKAILEALAGGPKVPAHPFNHRLYVHHLQSYVFDHVSHHSEDRQHPFLSLPWIVESFPVR